MTLNVGQKIFSIALVTLLLMVSAALYSMHLIDNIADDLASISNRQIPVAEGVGRINVHILEQGVLLERMIAEAEAGITDGAAIERQRDRFTKLGEIIDKEFATARILLTAEENDPDIGRHARGAIDTLNRGLADLESEYHALRSHGVALLERREKGETQEFDALLARHDKRQDAFDVAVSALSKDAERLTTQAVANADRDEWALLITNGVLTALAAVLGFGFAIMVTRALVGAVRNLVSGTEAVEAGDLDTEVAIVSRDEVGQLTGSFNTMVDGLRLKERIKDTFGKYMDPRIVTNLLDNPEFAEPGGERREMTVMFIDLKGFTSISERLAADDLVRMINGFFGHMTQAISGNDGVVDKFMGDAVMAYWGPPFTAADQHAPLACKAALAAFERLETFRAEVAAELGADAAAWARAEADIDLRIGISTGEMVVGTIGSTASRSFTVMGDPVNLGSRLEGANKAYGTHVMISDRTRELAGDAPVRELDLIRVKGKEEPTRVFELRASAAPADFEAGVAAYRSQNWDAAEAAFQACLKVDPDDTPSMVYLDRVAHLRAAPPPTDWDGVWVFDTK